jgi:hypothetical protein
MVTPGGVQGSIRSKAELAAMIDAGGRKQLGLYKQLQVRSHAVFVAEAGNAIAQRRFLDVLDVYPGFAWEIGVKRQAQ